MAVVIHLAEAALVVQDALDAQEVAAAMLPMGQKPHKAARKVALLAVEDVLVDVVDIVAVVHPVLRHALADVMATVVELVVQTMVVLQAVKMLAPDAKDAHHAEAHVMDALAVQANAAHHAEATVRHVADVLDAEDVVMDAMAAVKATAIPHVRHVHHAQDAKGVLPTVAQHAVTHVELQPHNLYSFDFFNIL